MRRFAILLLACLLLPAAGCREPQPDGAAPHEVRIAAAADLRHALDDVAAELQRERPDIRVQVAYGASGSLFAQLQNQAPFDLFLSADIDYPRRLIDAGLAEGEFTYAIGRLVVWVPHSSTLNFEQRGLEALTDPAVKKVAIANPKFAPYGRAAEAALKQRGVYDRIRDKLVFGENVAQAAQFVQSGAADAGIIARSLAQAPPLRDAGRAWDVPADAYPKLEQGGAITAWARDKAAAEAVRQFLLGEAGQAVLRRHGFRLPGDG